MAAQLTAAAGEKVMYEIPEAEAQQESAEAQP
jgi:hypothetical protein